MTSKPDADQRLLDAHDLALAALREITPSSTIGPAAGYLLEHDGSVSLRFANRLPGYPGWHWTVTVARVDEDDPTVLELELLPGDGALLAPEWVPWAERLAEYRAHQVELAEQAAASAADGADSGAGGELIAVEDLEDDDLEDDELEDDELDDELEEDALDDDDEDASESRVLHAGDLDGVDIDELDDSVVLDDDADFDEDESDEIDESVAQDAVAEHTDEED